MLPFHFKDGKFKKLANQKIRTPLFAQDSSFKISQTWLCARMITWLGFKIIISLPNRSQGLEKIETLFLDCAGFVYFCLFDLPEILLHIRSEPVDLISAHSFIPPTTWMALSMYLKTSGEDDTVGVLRESQLNITYPNTSQKW